MRSTTQESLARRAGAPTERRDLTNKAAAIAAPNPVKLPASQNQVRAVRLLDNGQLDLAFGASGLGDPIIAYGATPFGGLALAPDGGFFFVGVLYEEGVPFSGKWFVARYLRD